MKLFRRIGQPTPKKNKIIGQITTFLGVASVVIAESGLVDNRPVLKLGLEILSVKFGGIALYNAQKVDKDGQVNN